MAPRSVPGTIFRQKGSDNSRRQRDGTIEGDKPSSILHGQREEIDIGHLAWAVNVAGVDAAVFEETDGAGPELVVLGAGRPAQTLDGLKGRNRARVPGLADDADEPVLRQGAGCPAVLDLSRDPLLGSAMVDVVCIRSARSTLMSRSARIIPGLLLGAYR